MCYPIFPLFPPIFSRTKQTNPREEKKSPKSALRFLPCENIGSGECGAHDSSLWQITFPIFSYFAAIIKTAKPPGDDTSSSSRGSHWPTFGSVTTPYGIDVGPFSFHSATKFFEHQYFFYVGLPKCPSDSTKGGWFCTRESENVRYPLWNDEITEMDRCIKFLWNSSEERTLWLILIWSHHKYYYYFYFFNNICNFYLWFSIFKWAKILKFFIIDLIEFKVISIIQLTISFFNL